MPSSVKIKYASILIQLILNLLGILQRWIDQILTKESEVNDIILHYFNKFKGENSFKLYIRITEHFVGISKARIQSWINSNNENCERHPLLRNKDALKPIVASKPLEICQIDLVRMDSSPSKDEYGNIYYYILSALDVFSRFVILIPLKTKKSSEVANHLKNLFYDIGVPETLQCYCGIRH